MRSAAVGVGLVALATLMFASTLAIVVALNAGFRLTLAAGAVCYAGALVIALSLRRE